MLPPLKATPKVKVLVDNLQVDELKQKIALHEERIKELEMKLSEKEKSVEEVRKLSDDFTQRLLTCEARSKSLEIDYLNLKSTEDNFDVAINAQASKKLIKEYREIKGSLTKAKQE